MSASEPGRFDAPPTPYDPPNSFRTTNADDAPDAYDRQHPANPQYSANPQDSANPQYSPNPQYSDELPYSDELLYPDKSPNPFEPPTEPALAPVKAAEEVAPGDAEPAEAAPARTAGRLGLIGVFALGSLVAVGFGAYGRLHEPTFSAINVAGFSSGAAAKAWLATLAFVLALVQLGSALVMYGRLPKITAPRWIGALHRWSGRVAVLVTVPVAVHCLYALGFQTGSVRVLVHSLFGCFFYGAFVAKMLILNRRDAPGWTLPALGGAVFTGLVALWATSAAWFFGTSGFTF